MLIRWVGRDDTAAWQSLAQRLPPFSSRCEGDFRAYAKERADSYEALTAVDFISGVNMGFVGFSRQRNTVEWLYVRDEYTSHGVGSRLLKTALRQLDASRTVSALLYGGSEAVGAQRKLYGHFGFKDGGEVHNYHGGLFDGHDACKMTADLSDEKRGGSFHYDYPSFIAASDEKNCPACIGKDAPSGQVDIETNERVWICGEYPGQGRLFGKLYVMPRKHYFHFEDIPQNEAAAFMLEVQRAGKALRTVTGAVKINYEMHANSGTHLHIHLFPRYLDDGFPSAPIDYRVTEPAPYESREEFLCFIGRMKTELAKI